MISCEVHGAGGDAAGGSETRRRRSAGKGLPYLFAVWLSTALLPFAPTSHAEPPGWTFVDVSASVGLAYEHGYISGITNERLAMAGGVAAGDYDGDGWIDLYLIRGDIGPNLLLRNQGDGTFRIPASDPGVSGPVSGCGAQFADLDGDGWLDLIVGGVDSWSPAVLRNRGDGTFEDVSLTAAIDNGRNIFSSALGDYDGDGDLDLAVTHWTGYVRHHLTLFQNDGNGAFTDVSVPTGVASVITLGFTPVFTDITGDGRPDLLVAGDFGTSVVLFNDGAGKFVQNTASPISDQNGMGSAVGDYNNDGHLDWFVSSIWDPDQQAEGGWGVTGNRLYRNNGSGVFLDATDKAGVRVGYWGWASCFADFNNDGWLDLFHVNGMSTPAAVEFHADPSRLFISQGNGTFLERSVELGIDDTEQGRGVACFDYDRDGDVDIFISNNSGPVRLYRNDGGNANPSISLSLAGTPPNTEGIGAKIYMTAAGMTQMREMRAGSNYVSANPVEAHFGLGAATIADELRVEWPDGTTTVFTDVPAGQYGSVAQASVPPPAVPDGRNGTAPMRVDKTDVVGNRLLVEWDTATCADVGELTIILGSGSDLPTSMGQQFAASAAVCGVSNTAPYLWTGVPAADADPSGLLWWLLVATDGAGVEGSWGLDAGTAERHGPGSNGASALCGVVSKDLLNVCGR